MPVPAPTLPLPPGTVGPADIEPKRLALPLLSVRATCGFPSPAEDFFGVEDLLDLNQRCIDNPVATFFMEADTGESMVGFGIYPGDTLVVDRSRNPQPGDIVIAIWEGGFVCKQLRKRAGRFELHSGHPDHAPIQVPPDVELEVWGVVTWSFRSQVRRMR